MIVYSITNIFFSHKYLRSSFSLGSQKRMSTKMGFFLLWNTNCIYPRGQCNDWYWMYVAVVHGSNTISTMVNLTSLPSSTGNDGEFILLNWCYYLWIIFAHPYCYFSYRMCRLPLIFILYMLYIYRWYEWNDTNERKTNPIGKKDKMEWTQSNEVNSFIVKAKIIIFPYFDFVLCKRVLYTDTHRHTHTHIY